jgi:hypothetical protein
MSNTCYDQSYSVTNSIERCTIGRRTARHKWHRVHHLLFDDFGHYDRVFLRGDRALETTKETLERPDRHVPIVINSIGRVG